MLCLAPIVLIGQLFTQSWSFTGPHEFNHQTNLDGQVIEVQTCETGAGVVVNAATNGLYGAGVQYGFTAELGKWRATLQPQFGASYVDHPLRELPRRTQFEVGAELLLGYEQYRLGVKYWHMSNGGGHTSNNIGVNLIAIMGGWAF